MMKNTSIHAVFAVFLLLPGVVSASENVVMPGESIQAVLWEVQPGDIVTLHCGFFHEQGLVIPEGVTLRSLSGQPDCATIISDGTAPIILSNGATGATVIEGITFTRNPTAQDLTHKGGGVLCSNSSPSFLNCRFESLEAVYGGAVFCEDSSHPIFTDCVFRGNHAHAVGGAVACRNICEPLLENCLIVNNTAVSAGGAFNLALGSHLGLFRSTVADNALEGGMATSCWGHAEVVAVSSILAEPSIWIGDADGLFRADCSDIYSGQETVPVDPGFGSYISADPLFCATLAGDHKYNLDESSPCTPEAAPECEGMGAMPVGCSLSPTPDPVPGPALPRVARLNGAYPNPFNPSTTIQYDLSQSGQTEIAVYDLAGRRIASLVDEAMPAGSHEVTWQGRDAQGRVTAAGVYFVRLKTATKLDTRRITLVK